MKKCPTCEAMCFDDMEVCYGCLHRFETAEVPLVSPAPSVKRPKSHAAIASMPGEKEFRGGKHVMTVPAVSVVPEKGGVSLEETTGDMLVLRIEVPRSAQTLTVGYGSQS